MHVTDSTPSMGTSTCYKCDPKKQKKKKKKKNGVNALITVFLPFIDHLSILLCKIPFSSNGLKKEKMSSK